MEQPAQLPDVNNRSLLATFVVPPAPILSQYIDLYYGEEAILNDYTPQFMPHEVLMLSTGYVEMHIGYHDTSWQMTDGNASFSFHCVIAGEHNVQSVYRVSNFKGQCKSIHVKFKPGGFYGLLGIYESEIRNKCFDLRDVLGHEGEQLENRLNNSASMKERLRILNRFFVDKIGQRRTERSIQNSLAARKSIILHEGKLKVTQLLKELGIPKRTLERQFTNHIGLSPKEYSRVVRFRSVLNRMLSADLVDWGEVVESYGYYDQAHFDNEFKTATSLSPEWFLKEKGKTIFKFRNGLFITAPLEAQPTSYGHLIKKTAESGTKANFRGI